MEKVTKAGKLSLEKIIEYILDIKTQNSIRKLKGDIKSCVYSTLALSEILYPLMEIDDCKMDIDKNLFNQKYDLNIAQKTKNKIMLAITILTLINKTTGMEQAYNTTEILLQAISSQNMDADKTINILITYANELIKSIEETSYVSCLISQLKEACNEAQLINIKRARDIENIAELDIDSDFAKGVSLGVVSAECENKQQNIYRRILKDYMEK